MDFVKEKQKLPYSIKWPTKLKQYLNDEINYPIVYNISLAIPFIAVPALGILISYLATAAGFMSPAFVQVPWTTPVFLNAWLATSLAAFIMQGSVPPTVPA